MRLACAALALLLLVGCGNPPQASTPAPPNSPQTTVTLTVKTVADSAQAGVKTVIALRDQGKLSQANTTTIENWLGFVATNDKSISLILANGQPWASQKADILKVLATIMPPVNLTLSPDVQTIIAQIMTLINQIRVQVQS